MKLIPADPVNLSVKNKLFVVILCFSVIFLTANFSPKIDLIDYPGLIASMGASAVILFVTPSSPFAQPWPLLGGHLLSTVIGVTCAQWIPNILLASASAVGASVFVMLMCRCIHPPGAASALAPVLSGEHITALGYHFVLLPVALNVSSMLILAIVINRWLRRLEYPMPMQHTNVISANHIHESAQIIEEVLQDKAILFSLNTTDSTNKLHNESAYPNQDNITINHTDLIDDTIAIEYTEEFESLWQLVQHEQLKSLPVIDQSGQIIGTLTWHDARKNQ